MSSLGQQSQVEYWRSLAERDGTALRGEPAPHDAGPEMPAGHGPDMPAGFSRRRWLQLMGASLALAGAGGCHWEERELVPENTRAGRRVPGVPQQYATALDIGGSAVGLLVTAVDGRPIKIEGNPLHPQSLGATDQLAQATILHLYDPDRGRQVRHDGKAETWQGLAKFAGPHFADLRKTGGKGLRILAEAHSSPTLARLRARLLKQLPEAQWVEYEAYGDDNARAGAIAAFGQPVRTHLALAQAQRVLTLDADLWAGHPAALQYIRDFTQNRGGGGQMSRLYAVESCVTLTGASADHRLPLPSSQIRAFALALERMASGKNGQTVAAALPAGLDAKSPVAVFLKVVAEDLLAHRGKSVVVAGAGQPPEVHAAVHRLNAALDAVGKTVTYTADPQPQRPLCVDGLRKLVDDMKAGSVQTLLLAGGNPVYDAPSDLNFSEALAKVHNRLRLAPYADETAEKCNWYLPQAHYLEAWADARSYDGTYSVAQPLIAPLLGGKSMIEVLALLLGESRPAEQLVRETFEEIVGPLTPNPSPARGEGSPVAGSAPAKGDGGKSDAAWRKCLHDGLLAGSGWKAESPQLKNAAAEKPAKQPPPLAEWNGKDLEIVFGRDLSVYDGRFANNGWLQESPDPITKLTWDNAAVMSPATATALAVQDESVVRLKYGGRELDLPVYVMPGVAAGTVAVALGYGRTAAGQVGGLVAEGIAAVGGNAYLFRTSRAMDFDGGLSITATGGSAKLATTQVHHQIDKVGREAIKDRVPSILRETTAAALAAPPKGDGRAGAHGAAEHETPLSSLWNEFTYEGHRWGMAIDLSKCIGCNACTVACQAENNVPIVGKERVLRGREMHWIRLDRYFTGDDVNPRILHQPVACQQCELAPCEQVCPVGATTHSHEGLNDMAYNRCVGTRYCSNNCPYKVRRFNFFNYHKFLEEPANEMVKMLYNPEVTIRHRGVMEKCTYCVQRIQAVKIQTKNQSVAAAKELPIADGQIQTACQQVCPAQAIVFGDLNDPHSQVKAAHDNAQRAYAMLGEFNFRPRTAYLARVRNPHPALEPLA